MRYRVCCLKVSEVRKFRNTGLLPECKNCNPRSNSPGNHDHVYIDDARGLVGNDDGTGVAVWIGTGFRMLFREPSKIWRKVNGVKQLIPGVEAGRKGHFSCEVAAHGARGRRMRVADVNGRTNLVSVEQEEISA